MLTIFNTLTRKLETFSPIENKKVGIYTCGPTVYNAPHIGNFRTFVWEDILVRYLRLKGFKVTHVMNLTDVDDKTIRGSRVEGIPLNDFTARYKAVFFHNLKTLNVVPANFYPSATEHVPEMVSLVQKLLDEGLAYRAADKSIYFKISEFPGYGKLSKFKIKKLKEGARVKQDEYEKQEAHDFALWKAYDESDGNVFWETPLGKGRPGWHIECSAMSMKFLGESFDIHTGGIDNMFPHHENEIAQSEAATGRPFVKYWLHAKHLLVNGEKMSKSKGNFFTLEDLKSFDPMAIRFVLISNHYRKTANFSFEEVRKTQDRLGKINESIRRLLSVTGSKKSNPNVPKMISDALERFEMGLDDDLNVPKALVGLNELVRKTNLLLEENGLSESDAKLILDGFHRIDNVLGVFSFEKKQADALDPKLLDLIRKREEMRKQKKWSEADDIRKQLLNAGIELMDTSQGTTWKKTGS